MSALIVAGCLQILFPLRPADSPSQKSENQSTPECANQLGPLEFSKSPLNRNFTTDRHFHGRIKVPNNSAGPKPGRRNASHYTANRRPDDDIFEFFHVPFSGKSSAKNNDAKILTKSF
jgi:hypothetical protein